MTKKQKILLRDLRNKTPYSFFHKRNGRGSHIILTVMDEEGDKTTIPVSASDERPFEVIEKQIRENLKKLKEKQHSEELEEVSMGFDVERSQISERNRRDQSYDRSITHKPPMKGEPDMSSMNRKTQEVYNTDSIHQERDFYKGELETMITFLNKNHFMMDYLRYVREEHIIED